MIMQKKNKKFTIIDIKINVLNMILCTNVLNQTLYIIPSSRVQAKL